MTRGARQTSETRSRHKAYGNRIAMITDSAMTPTSSETRSRHKAYGNYWDPRQMVTRSGSETRSRHKAYGNCSSSALS